MYWEDRWIFQNSIEYEYKWAGRYGAAGEKREKRKAATPEQMARQNQLNRENRVRRLMKANFRGNDLWVTLKYPAGTRKAVDEVTADMRKFLKKLRGAYKKRGDTLKFIYRLEIGSRGGIHVHILVNRLAGEEHTDILVNECWTPGRIHYEPIDEGFERLAAYIVKEPDDAQAGQLSLFPEDEKNKLIKYSTSRNLIRPKPERKLFKRRTVRKLIEEGPKPSDGFYIDKSTLHSGINRFTGYSYLRYTEIRITAEIQNMEGGG